MAKTLAQKAADAALDDALAKVLKAYRMLPDGHGARDVLLAMQSIANGIVEATIEGLWDDSSARPSGDTSTLNSATKVS